MCKRSRYAPRVRLFKGRDAHQQGAAAAKPTRSRPRQPVLWQPAARAEVSLNSRGSVKGDKLPGLILVVILG
jgi:hypothetical protein